MNTLLNEIHDLLAFEVKNSSRHNLDEIRITIPRAKALCNAIRVARHNARMSCSIVKHKP
jgi:hypothetical protein